MFHSLIKGFVYASRNIRMVLLMYVFNFLFTLPLIIPVYLLIMATVRGRPIARAMFGDKLDAIWLIDFLNNRLGGFTIESLGVSLALVPVFAIGYMLVNAFFSGGILSMYNLDEKRAEGENGNGAPRLSILNAYVANVEADLKMFWSGCWKYFGRFFRLMIVSMIFHAAIIFAAAIIYKYFKSYTDSVDAFSFVVYKQLSLFILLILAFAIVNMIFDYAKIGIVVYAAPSVVRETARAVGFTLQRFIGAFVLYSSLSIIGLAIYVALTWVRSDINQSSIKTVLLAILLGQIAIFSRMWFKAVILGAQFAYYRR